MGTPGSRSLSHRMGCSLKVADSLSQTRYGQPEDMYRFIYPSSFDHAVCSLATHTTHTHSETVSKSEQPSSGLLLTQRFPLHLTVHPHTGWKDFFGPCPRVNTLRTWSGVCKMAHFKGKQEGIYGSHCKLSRAYLVRWGGSVPGLPF